MDSSQILTRLQLGGAEELTAIFQTLRPQMRAMIHARLDRRLHARVDASDIVQESFLRAVKGLQAYLESPKVPPVVWLRLIGKHIVAETHRRHFRLKRTPFAEKQSENDSEDLLVNQIVDSIPSIGSAVAQAELIGKVRAMLSDLPEIDREIIEMRHIDGMSIQEAAGALEISVDAAKKRYYRGLSRFREMAEHLITGEKQRAPE